MAISPLMLAMAVVAAPIGPELESDLRCLATFSVMAGMNKDPANDTILALGGYYYVGKIEVRGPGIDLGKELNRIWSSSGYDKQYRADFDRCIVEVQSWGKKLIKIGESG
ncbi:MAG: hypothetical protein ABL912_01060 [Novosphingobium sp.]